MIQGYIDRIDEAGFVSGWVRDHAIQRPALIEIFEGDELIAQAVADQFRRDLFRDGVGHGHYGFRARILHNRPITSRLGLWSVAHEQWLNPEDGTIHESSQSQKDAILSVQDLIMPPVGWEEGDLLEYTASLRLPRSLASMSPLRFLDIVHRYLLGRWSDDSARQRYLDPLRTTEIHPDDLFRTILISPERRTNGLPLTGPFSYQFPFDLTIYSDL